MHAEQVTNLPPNVPAHCLGIDFSPRWRGWQLAGRVLRTDYRKIGKGWDKKKWRGWKTVTNETSLDSMSKSFPSLSHWKALFFYFHLCRAFLFHYNTCHMLSHCCTVERQLCSKHSLQMPSIWLNIDLARTDAGFACLFQPHDGKIPGCIKGGRILMLEIQHCTNPALPHLRRMRLLCSTRAALHLLCMSD